MSYEPTSDRVLLKRIHDDAVTASGLHVPESAQKKSQRAHVVAAGPGRLIDDGARLPMSVAPGDVVLIPRYGGEEIEIDGEDCVIVSERDILATVES